MWSSRPGAGSTDPGGSVLRGVAAGRAGDSCDGVSRRTRARCCGPGGWAGRPCSACSTCGAYSKATAADLLLPRLLTGEPPSLTTVSRLGHGGILTREMRFRFPSYARDLEAPDG